MTVLIRLLLAVVMLLFFPLGVVWSAVVIGFQAGRASMEEHAAAVTAEIEKRKRGGS